MKQLSVRTKDASMMLGVSEIWMKKDRALPPEQRRFPTPIKVSRARLYPVAELENWLEEQREFCK